MTIRTPEEVAAQKAAKQRAIHRQMVMETIDEMIEKGQEELDRPLFGVWNRDDLEEIKKQLSAQGWDVTFDNDEGCGGGAHLDITLKPNR